MLAYYGLVRGFLSDVAFAEEELAKLVGDSWEIDSETDSLTDARKVYFDAQVPTFSIEFRIG